MKKHIPFLALFTGLCLCFLTTCSSEEESLPDFSDIKTTIREEGIWVVIDVSIKNVNPVNVEECGIDWMIYLDNYQQQIGEKDHSMKAEGGRLNYSFRIFPWDKFHTSSISGSCKIHVNTYIRSKGKVIRGGGHSEKVQNGSDVNIWNHKSEIVDHRHILFHGEIYKADTLSIEECGMYWSEKKSFDLKDYVKCVSPERTPQFTVTIKDIAHLPKIYNIGYVKTPYGTIYSEISSSYIPGGDVTIAIASEIKNRTFEQLTVSAECTVENPIIYPITERGFCYVLNTKDNYPTIQDPKITVGSGDGSFTGTITGLEPASKYVIRAYAISNKRATYSKGLITYTLNSSQFTPIVSLKSANVNQPGQILLEGKILEDLGYLVTKRGFCYNTSGKSPTIEDQTIVAEGTGLGTFRAALNLKAGKYFIKAYAINQAGINYSIDYREVVIE